MRASILLTALPLAAAACAVSPEVTPYPADARPDSIDASGPNSDGGGPGPGPDANPMGDAGSPGDGMPAPLAIGWPEPYTAQTLIPAETLFAFRLPPIDTPASLVGWGVTSVEGGSLIRMALYTDNSGTPGDLVTWTGVWPINDGVYDGGGFPLDAGTYWLVLITDADFELGQQAGELVDACVQTAAFDTSFETSFSAASCMQLDAVSIYILVQ